MAGVLSRVFESESDAGRPASQPETDRVGEDLNDGGASGAGTATEQSDGQSQQDASADIGFDVAVSLHLEGSYRDEDGNETLWSRDLDVAFSTDNHVGLGSLTDLGDDGMSSL